VAARIRAAIVDENKNKTGRATGASSADARQNLCGRQQLPAGGGRTEVGRCYGTSPFYSEKPEQRASCALAQGADVRGRSSAGLRHPAVKCRNATLRVSSLNEFVKRCLRRPFNTETRSVASIQQFQTPPGQQAPGLLVLLYQTELRWPLSQLPAGFEPATWALKVRSMAGLRHPAGLGKCIGAKNGGSPIT
jgi:hypothetical protein